MLIVPQQKDALVRHLFVRYKPNFVLLSKRQQCDHLPRYTVASILMRHSQHHFCV